MSELDLPPERIRHLVDSGPDWITFPSSKRPQFWILAGFLVGLLGILLPGSALVLGMLALSAWIGEPDIAVAAGALVALAPIPVLVAPLLGLLIGWVSSSTPRSLTVRSTRATYSGFFAPPDVELRSLLLSGDPGYPLVLRADGQLLTHFQLTTRRRGWDYDSVTWVAQRVSQISGAPLTDLRPADAWRRWREDPIHRAQVHFDIKTEHNQKKFPRHHSTTATPPKVEIDLEKVVIELNNGLFRNTTLRMDPHTLQLDGRRYPLSEISRAVVRYRKIKTQNSVSYSGRLTILVGDRVKSIATMTVTRTGGTGASHLNWVAAEILRYAQQASPVPEQGDPQDIPDSIASMVQSNRAPE